MLKGRGRADPADGDMTRGTRRPIAGVRDGSPPGLNLAWWFWLSLLYASAPIG